jgi:hypothetical protein
MQLIHGDDYGDGYGDGWGNGKIWGDDNDMEMMIIGLYL